MLYPLFRLGNKTKTTLTLPRNKMMISSSTLSYLLLLCLHASLVASSDGQGEVEVGDDLDISTRIVGGSDASPGAYPFFAQWSGCGASLIWEDILLTAAHCNVLESNVVLVGAYKSFTIQGGEINSEVRNIVERRPHAGWNPQSYENDILILKLDQPSYRQMAIYNTNASMPQNYDPLTVIGLGSTQPRADLSLNTSAIAVPINVTQRNDTISERSSSTGSFLQEVAIKQIPDDVCNGDSMFRGYIKTNIMLCAGEEDGGKDACNGDSGGPLIQKMSDGRMIQVGIVSFGSGCARANRPGIYTRVSSYTSWIHAQICDLSSNPPSSCSAESTGRSANSTATPSSAPSRRFPSRSPTISPTVAPVTIGSAASDTRASAPSASPSVKPPTDNTQTGTTTSAHASTTWAWIFNGTP